MVVVIKNLVVHLRSVFSTGNKSTLRTVVILHASLLTLCELKTPEINRQLWRLGHGRSGPFWITMAIVSSIIKTWLTISRWRLSISTVVRVNVRAGEYGHFRSYITDNINRTSSHHVVNYIKENTEITRDHLTPEIGLHLVTPKCRLWTAPEADAICPDPFWAFYWSGGQVLTRYVSLGQFTTQKSFFSDKH